MDPSCTLSGASPKAGGEVCLGAFLGQWEQLRSPHLTVVGGGGLQAAPHAASLVVRLAPAGQLSEEQQGAVGVSGSWSACCVGPPLVGASGHCQPCHLVLPKQEQFELNL